jgi:VWFA-related protein
LARRWAGLLLAFSLLAVVTGYQRTSAQASQQASNSGEVSVHETQAPYTMRSERNLVLVRVVIRDRSGNAVAGLRKEDFKLFDNGKPQIISDFNIESTIDKTHVPPLVTPPTATNASVTENEPATSLPERFVALYFDDVHLTFEDTVRTRDAAKKYLQQDLRPSDRAAIFTSSGRLLQDFTANRDLLIQTLDHLQPHPLTANLSETNACPYITPYQAYQINAQQSDAIQLAVLDIIDCQCNGDARNCPSASEEAVTDARRVSEFEDTQSRYSVRELEALIRHLSALPGERSIVFVSPGFLTDELKFELSQITDRALHARVIINTLDPRGLFASPPGGDASVRNSGQNTMQRTILRDRFNREELMVSADVLSQLAAETGGVWFHNNNDYDAGFKRAGDLAETSYILAFSPQNLKFDGSFHKLKVELANPSGLTAQARRGYFAPRKAEDPAAREKEDIQEAVFSRDDVRELPMNVSTQFFKTDNMNARLSVVAHIDLSTIHFLKEDGRNVDDLMLVAALFDTDGNYITSTSETIQMHLRDATLDKLSHSGISVKTSMGVKVGSYLMRVVVRDSQSTRIAALSRAVTIPY